MDEVEVKLLLQKPELVALRKKLAKAKRLGKVTERNFILDYDDFAFAKRGCLLRMRFAGKKNTLTFKGPKSKNSKFKSRQETELDMGKVADCKKFLKSFSKLGLRTCWRYDKARESFQFAGCHIDVDTLPLLGTIVEIESDSDANVQKAIDALGLSKARKSNASYYDLARAYFAKKGLPVRNLIIRK